ncbi:MAG: dTMP kinase [Gammaproteobacteria bacterium]|nr:dTMP kinase [Gammaproteobacteria bacterium]MCP5424289.1 dTMP kinase [Gammaproteobacteria bacterium]MCP5459042.1 dTMP kinase [Gammaproteobacteria bacterium]
MKGKFITVEGIEGAGKTTQLGFMQNYLRQHGLPVALTREPGGTPLGEQLRHLVLHAGQPEMSVDSELLLLFAARAEHLHRVIGPALLTDTWVLCDRFTDATYAYQGGGRGIAAERIAFLEQWVQGGLRPDLTLLFDLPVEVGLERARRRAHSDRFERENPSFFERVRQTYRQLAANEPHRYRVIDANRPVDQVRADVERLLDTLLAKPRD